MSIESKTNSSQIKELESIVGKFCDQRDWGQFHGAKDLAIGLSTESNELLDIFRFKTDEQIKVIFSGEKPEVLNHIGEELADILFFLLRFSQKYKIDLVKVFTEKLAENGKKYPVEKSKGCNKKYDEL